MILDEQVVVIQLDDYWKKSESLDPRTVLFHIVIKKFDCLLLLIELLDEVFGNFHARVAFATVVIWWRQVLLGVVFPPK